MSPFHSAETCNQPLPKLPRGQKLPPYGRVSASSIHVHAMVWVGPIRLLLIPLAAATGYHSPAAIDDQVRINHDVLKGGAARVIWPVPLQHPITNKTADQKIRRDANLQVCGLSGWSAVKREGNSEGRTLFRLRLHGHGSPVAGKNASRR